MCCTSNLPEITKRRLYETVELCCILNKCTLDFAAPFYRPYLERAGKQKIVTEKERVATVYYFMDLIGQHIYTFGKFFNVKLCISCVLLHILSLNTNEYSSYSFQ